MNTGIDYSGHTGTCNRGPTGIRYGVMSANCESLNDWFWESVEPHYSEWCPNCCESLDEGWESAGEETDDYNYCCPHCGHNIDDGDQYGEEPDANIIQDSEITGFVASSNDIWVTDSPFYTHAQYCSPCAPGAGHLENPCDDGVRTYCLGHDWFDGQAPYPVYSIKTEELVMMGYAS